MNGSVVRSSAWTWATVAVAVAVGGERDPRRQPVALGRHERERLLVSVDDHDAGRHLDRRAGDGRDVEQGDLAGRDAGQRRVEREPLGQNVGKRSFQWAMRPSGWRRPRERTP